MLTAEEEADWDRAGCWEGVREVLEEAMGRDTGALDAVKVGDFAKDFMDAFN